MFNSSLLISFQGTLCFSQYFFSINRLLYLSSFLLAFIDIAKLPVLLLIYKSVVKTAGSLFLNGWFISYSLAISKVSFKGRGYCSFISITLSFHLSKYHAITSACDNR